MQPLLATEGDSKVLREILSGLERRVSLPGGAAREELDHELVERLARLRRAPPEMAQPLRDPPPRPIAVAMALTLFSQPHLVATFGRPGSEDPDRPTLRPVLVPVEVMSELLGLARWELEELQGEIDRRVSRHLKQHRALAWLWGHFGLPGDGVAALVEVLLPGLREENASTVGLSRRGGQLYALLDMTRSTRSAAMYLGWLDRHIEGVVPPKGTFSARYVDKSLRRTLGRCIGADEREVLLLLDRTVTVVPRGQAEEFLAADRWRALAYEAITGVSGGYPKGADLDAVLPAGDVPFEGWMRRDGEGVQLDNGKALFDSVALDRVSEVARQLHAHTLATILAEPEVVRSGYHSIDELVRYDVRRHLQTVLSPVVDWTVDPTAVERVTRRLGVPLPAARSALISLQHTWKRHMDATWVGDLTDEGPDSVAVRLAAQLVSTRHSLAALWNRGCAHGQEHREAALLFAAHYFAEAPLDRLWGRDQDGLAEDPVGKWFWPLWLAVLELHEPDSAADVTFSL